MKEKYRKLVEQIFNNWSALQLAVEHAMGGPNSKQIAIACVDYITNYCVSEHLEVEDIEDVLEDIMDQEFNTVCEDNSIKEVSTLLHQFLQLLREGNTTQYDIEYNKLPNNKQWLSDIEHLVVNVQPETSNEPVINDVDMQEDPGWTQVRSKKKR